MTHEVERAVHARIREVAFDLEAEIIAVNGMADHVHVLLAYPPTLSVAEAVKRFKGATSYMVNHELPPPDHVFRWQDGYGAFSVSARILPRVRAYVANQKAHHHDGTTHPAAEPGC